MATLIEITRDALDARDVPEKVLEKTGVHVRRAVVELNKKGVFPPKIFEFNAGSKKEERRDGNGNLWYNFIFLPEDFYRLDRLNVIKKNTEDENETKIYQWVTRQALFNKRKDTDSRNLFTIVDYNIDDEEPRKILILDPFPSDDDYIEVKYFLDGSTMSIENIGTRYWESVISMVEKLLGLKSKADALDDIGDESASWRDQQGSNSVNKTMAKTKVRFPWGKT